MLTINKGETPIRAELRGYFREVLRPASGRSKPQRRRRIELCCAGEVLTSDEVVERMERADARKAAEKAAKKAVKKTSSKSKNKSVVGTTVTQEEDADVYCEKGTQAYYTDAEADIWIGCNSCETRWHYQCTGRQMVV